jgi:biotin transport system substrate-specific component
MISQLTIADLARPSERKLAVSYDIALVLAGSAWIAMCTQIACGQPVPITGQTFAVLLAGALLGPRRGALSVLAYILEGLAGLPVFAQGKAGPLALAGPTGGYLIGFVVAAYVVGVLAQRGWDRRPVTTALAMIAGNIVLYSFGLAWLFCLSHMFARPLSAGILAVGLYPFLLGDTIKIAVAVAILPSAWKIFRHFGVDKIAKLC